MICTISINSPPGKSVAVALALIIIVPTLSGVLNLSKGLTILGKRRYRLSLNSRDQELQGEVLY